MTGRHETDSPAAEERASTPNSSGPEAAAGGMGSSSERIGHVGPGQVGTDGLRDTSVVESTQDGPAERGRGDAEPQPEGVPPKAGYPSLDPRHEDKPYQP